MRYPDLIPKYAHLLCHEELSEVAEDVSQHLFQHAIDTGLLRLDEDDDASRLCSEPTMMRLLEVSAAAADVELRRLANRLEALLLQDFLTESLRQ